MGIGERRHRVVFQRAVITKDDFGEPDKSYVDICTSWARVQPIWRGDSGASEKVTSDYLHANINCRITTRNRRDLKDLGPEDRVTWSGHTYDIRSVIFRDQRASELEILAEEHL